MQSVECKMPEVGSLYILHSTFYIVPTSSDGAEGADAQNAQYAHDAARQQHAAHAGPHAAAANPRAPRGGVT